MGLDSARPALWNYSFAASKLPLLPWLFKDDDVFEVIAEKVTDQVDELSPQETS